MTIKNAIGKFRDYLILEKSLSPDSVSAYLNDIDELANFCIKKHQVKKPEEITEVILWENVNLLKNAGVDERTKRRVMSSYRSFFDFLVAKGITKENPAKLFLIKSIQRLPNFITKEEYESLLNVTQRYNPEGMRNRAIIVMLYSCGLTVSELIRLKISDIDFKTNCINVIGRKNKIRTIPLSKNTKREMNEYLKIYRNHFDLVEGIDTLFLSIQAKPLSRLMVFNIIKNLVKSADMKKRISAQTFRYTFAFQLLSSGKDIVTIRNLMGLESLWSVEKFFSPKNES